MTLENAILTLKKSKYKHTERRIEILRILANCNKFVNTKSILTEVKKMYPQLSTDTIYRNLEIFRELAIVETTELSGEKHFRFSCSNNKHHHHFICTSCGATEEIAICPMGEIRKYLVNHEILDHKLEVYGRCLVCI